jgi:hypothetical protein
MENQYRIAFEKSRQETCKMLLLIAGFNKNNLSEKEHDLLDEWVNREDYNQYLFEMFIDKVCHTALKKVVKSQKHIAAS